MNNVSMDTEFSDLISSLYFLPRIIFISKLNGGFLNENSVIGTEGGDKFVLKRHRESNARKIEYIESAEQFFLDHRIPVVLPVKTRDGLSHFNYQDRLYSLHPFVSGVQPKRNRLTQDHIVELAKMLARIHLSSKDGVPEIFLNETQKSWGTKQSFEKMSEIEAMIRGKDDKDDFDELALKSLELKRRFITTQTFLPEGFQFTNDTLVHGDYHDQNVFFDETGKISCVFDFEKAKFSSRFHELVRSMMLICFNHSFYENNFGNARIYLVAYHQLFPFGKNEFSMNLRAYAMKEFYSTWIEGEHYQKNNTVPDVFLPGSFGTLEYLKGNFDEFESKLLSWFDD